MDIEPQVARHYTHGSLERTILDALAVSGTNPDRLATADLSGADEFHLGWHIQTLELAREIGIAPGMRVLDIGSGIGGPARAFAEGFGAQVTGIDLTPEFVAVAESLTRRCGLSDRVIFKQGSALDLPFEDASFDVATLIHVGMNIADKAKLFREARRVLKQGGVFGVYDIMRTDDGDLPYPMPWAVTPATSFVETPEIYRALLAEAGFQIEKERDRRAFSLALAKEMREKAERDGPPLLGPQILMGASTQERLGNVMSALQRGLIAPMEMIARAI